MASANAEQRSRFQNFHLVLLDTMIDEINKDDCRNAIAKLQQVVNTVNSFIDVDKCIKFISGINQRLIVMILSVELLETVAPIVQGMSQVTSVYIFCRNKTRCEKSTQRWSKVKGIFIDIPSVCEMITRAFQKINHNSISVDFVETIDEVSKEDLDTLDSSFMYTQILKEILLTIDFQQVHIDKFLAYCREQFIDNSTELRNIDKVDKEYRDHHPIWWYTYESFLYKMLSRALRMMEVDLVIKMGFFLKDLHNHIVALHEEQFGGQHHPKTFIVYRGQGLSLKDFQKLKEAQSGLLSFNYFLSTHFSRDVAFFFCESAHDNSDMTGILFEITVNKSISSVPFANISHVSYYPEDEILFSMHSVFRIVQIKQIAENNRLWQVNLTLTNDNDSQLQNLTEYVRKETFPHRNGWYRLANFLIKLGRFGEAEQVCNSMLDETDDEKQKTDIYHMLGMVNDKHGNYEKAIKYYEESIKINQKILSPTDPNLASSYSNLGSVYESMGEYSSALSYSGKALDIWQKTLPANHPYLATVYNNIGVVHSQLGQYSKTLLYYRQTLEIRQRTLPENHPVLVSCFSNIGAVYDNIGKYAEALSYYKKASEIFQKTLPESHSDLATAYSNIGKVYYNMKEYSEALSCHERALKTFQKTFPEDHVYLALSYNNIGAVYDTIGEHLRALSYYEKALKIKEKSLSAKHPSLATSYNNMGTLSYNIGDYAKALLYYERALNIFQHALPNGHPNAKTVKENIDIVKQKL